MLERMMGIPRTLIIVRRQAGAGEHHTVVSPLSARSIPIIIRLIFKEHGINPCSFRMERMMGIEPTTAAWEAAVLPLNYIRK